MRLIDADALEPDADYDDGDYWAVSMVQIQNAPTIEPERKKGEWIKDRLVSTNGGTYGVYRCSICEHSYQDIGYGFNFCPDCGAYMRGEQG